MTPGSIGRALAWGICGLLLVPLVVLGSGLAMDRLSPACRTVGDAGGCATDIASLMILSAMPGAALFFVVTLAWASLRGPVPSRS